MGRAEPGEDQSRLIAAIYEAALDSTRWRSVLTDICQFIDAAEASLLFYDHQHSQRNFSITAYNTIASELISASMDAGIHHIKTLFCDSIPGKVHIFSVPSYAPGIFPDKHTVTQQVLELKLAIPLALGDIIVAALVFYTVRGSAELSPESIELIEILSPHLVKAVRLHNHLSVLKEENENLVEAIQRTNLAVFLLDANMRVVFTSPEALHILSTHPALSLNRNMHLQAYINAEQVRLEAILAEFLDDGFRANYVATEGICLPLFHPEKVHPLKLCFLSIQQQHSHLPDGLPCLAVFANDPERQRFISPQYLQQAYALTVTETQLAQLLLKGLGIADISAARGTAQETTRWQMKQIMYKTQTHSQTELTRLLTLLSNEFANEKSPLPLGESPSA